MSETDTRFLADLADFPESSRDEWCELVVKTTRSGDTTHPDERLVRTGEDGALRLALYARENVPTTAAAPTTWRQGELANVVSIDADDADSWNASVERELALGATGIAATSLPDGADVSLVTSVGHPVFVAMPPTTPVRDGLHLFADPISFALSAGVDPAQLDGLVARELSTLFDVPGIGRRGCAHLQFYSNAGATPAQEVGLMAATVVEFARSGDHTADQLRKLGIFTDLSTELFVNVAKLRALRTVWSRVLRALDDTNECAPYIVARTGRRTWSAVDPETNWIRGSVQTIAAFLGGANAVTVLPHDRVVADEPSPTARRTARDTTSVLALEGHLARVEDPARGSYFLEAETERVAREGWAFLQAIESRGGLLRALATGFIQAELGRAKAARRVRLKDGEAKLVGVNAFRLERDEPELVSVRTHRGWDLERESTPFEGSGDEVNA